MGDKLDEVTFYDGDILKYKGIPFQVKGSVTLMGFKANKDAVDEMDSQKTGSILRRTFLRLIK